MFELIRDLSESRAFRSESYLNKLSGHESAELLYAYLSTMFILLGNDSTNQWARDYVAKTLTHGSFQKFVSSATDMYVLAYSQKDNHYFQKFRFLNVMNSLRFGTTISPYAILTEFQGYLSVKDSKLRSTKRVVAYWGEAKSYDRADTIRHIKYIIKRKIPLSEILSELDKVKV